MEPDKSLEEALFRSHQATEKTTQAQSRLYNMSSSAEKHDAQQADSSHRKLHETPRNLLQSWDTLRQLDEELEAKNKQPDDSDPDM